MANLNESPEHLPTLSTGRTPAGEINHKVRGLLQIIYEIIFLYPKLAVAGYILALFFVVGVILLGYYTHHNPRLLKSTELTYANTTFDAIRTADELAEDFTEGSPAREEARDKAVVELTKYQAVIQTSEAKRLSLILAYYLEAVTQLPEKDKTCADLKLKAHLVEEQFETQNPPVSQNTLLRSEVAYTVCQSARSRIQNSTIICHDEALSYLIPQYQPPQDLCIFRHDDKYVQRNK